MAKSYKSGKWSGALTANLVGDATKTTPTLGEDFDEELSNLKTAQKSINNTIKSIKEQITALKNHAETGRMATDYLKNTEKRLNKIQNEMDAAVNAMSNQINSAQKAEWNRFRKLLQEWAATQNTAAGNATTAGTTDSGSSAGTSAGTTDSGASAGTIDSGASTTDTSTVGSSDTGSASTGA